MNKFMPLIVLGSALTAGCAILTLGNAPEHVWTQHPANSATLSAHKGEYLLRQSFAVQSEGVIFPNGISLKGYNFTDGKYSLISRGEHGMVYQPNNDFDGGGQVLHWGFYEPAKEILIDAQDRLCVKTYSFKRCMLGHNAQATKIETITEKSLQQSLRFNAVKDKRIQLSYREFRGESTRPAIKDEIEVDLNKSKLINYRGAHIQIIKATNQHIEYVVLSGFNRPE